MLSEKIGLVIPCFNEAKRINLNDFSTFLKSHPTCSILFVNDGSTDQTKTLLETYCRSQTQANFLDLEKNSGKAEAVRQGALHLSKTSSDLDWIGYWDADLATPLEEVDRFFWYVSSKINQTDFLIGTRVKLMGTDIRRHARRHYLGRFFATAASIVLRIPIYDTQCGAKVLRARLVPRAFEKPFLSHWIFDVELIMRVLKMSPQNIERGANLREIPLHAWQDLDGSKLKLRDWFLAPWELFQIWKTYR